MAAATASAADGASRLRSLRDRLRETTAEAHALLTGPSSTVVAPLPSSACEL